MVSFRGSCSMGAWIVLHLQEEDGQWGKNRVSLRRKRTVGHVVVLQFTVSHCAPKNQLCPNPSKSYDDGYSLGLKRIDFCRAIFQPDHLVVALPFNMPNCAPSILPKCEQIVRRRVFSWLEMDWPFWHGRFWHFERCRSHGHLCLCLSPVAVATAITIVNGNSSNSRNNNNG